MGVVNEVESVAVHLHLGEPLRALVALAAVVAVVADETLKALEDG